MWKTGSSCANFYLKYCIKSTVYVKTHLVHLGCQKNPQQESPHYYIPERNTLKQEMLFATGTIHKRSLVASTVTRTDVSFSVTGVSLYVSLSDLVGVCWKFSFSSLQFNRLGGWNQNKTSELFRKWTFPTVIAYYKITNIEDKCLDFSRRNYVFVGSGIIMAEHEI